jgi:antitoxin component YwqK of YwqJK toxin-antitoxin module
MKYTLLILFFIVTNTIGQSNLDIEVFIDPDTGKPFSGYFEIVDDNGVVVFFSEYYKGIKQGMEKTFYKNGVLKSVGKYSNGLLDSDLTKYYEDGSVKSISHFYNGVKDGHFMIVDPNGDITYMKYESGVLTNN